MQFGRQASAQGPADGGPIRVLVVDDSATIRALIRLALASDPRLRVVGEAANAEAATEQIARHAPHVMTLDVEMPGISGLDFLGHLMKTRPMPVVMISAETRQGSGAAIAALSLGAVDCIGKPSGALAVSAFDGLADVLIAAAGARLGPARAASAPRTPPVAGAGRSFSWNGRIILIGSSTGGVEALLRVLEGFPPDCPPTAIVQHMPASFLASFATRLDQSCPPRVAVATQGAKLAQGTVLIAPGGDHHLRLAGQLAMTCDLIADEKRNGHRPSVDVAFDSALGAARSVVAALLTGMGRDGADGLRRLRAAGARTLAQDEASSVVWGMPGAAWQIGAVEELLPLERIGPRLLELCSRTGAVAGA